MQQKKIITVFVLIAAAVLSCVDVSYFNDVLLNHTGTLVILCLLGWDIYKRFFSYTSFFCISIFCLFHILGARYLYSFVPYNEWAVNLIGWDADAYFGFARNHYDRLVHFLFGILAFPPMVEIFSRKQNLKFMHSVLFTWLCIQSFSMVYELIEWGAALVLSERSAENYNGQQGDVWDAHKDMALALLGSGIMFLRYLLKR